jgi:hypothetical protein
MERNMSDKEYKDGYQDGYAVGRFDEGANPTYSHRNGESTPPTEGGWYFIGYGQQDMKLWFVDFWGSNGKWFYAKGGVGYECIFYGPIPMPKGTVST